MGVSFNIIEIKVTPLPHKSKLPITVMNVKKYGLSNTYTWGPAPHHLGWNQLIFTKCRHLLNFYRTYILVVNDFARAPPLAAESAGSESGSWGGGGSLPICLEIRLGKYLKDLPQSGRSKFPTFSCHNWFTAKNNQYCFQWSVRLVVSLWPYFMLVGGWPPFTQCSQKSYTLHLSFIGLYRGKACLSEV